MAELAIKGHATHGRDVIKTLEMLGGINEDEYAGDNVFVYYFINNNYIEWCNECVPESIFISFTLEEFLEKYPYKVGDKVIAYYEGILAQFTIQDMRWNYELNKVEYKICSSWLDISVIQPYKEETMEEIKIDIPKGYEFAGVDDDKQQVVFQKIQPEYPKTYKECCDVLGLNTMDNDAEGYKADLIIRFQELLIARDAYWQIAGEQMGLGKSWEPEKTKIVYAIFYNFRKDTIDVSVYNLFDSVILCFPTEEMRDAFYENFKELIERCKELL